MDTSELTVKIKEALTGVKIDNVKIEKFAIDKAYDGFFNDAFIFMAYIKEDKSDDCNDKVFTIAHALYNNLPSDIYSKIDRIQIFNSATDLTRNFFAMPSSCNCEGSASIVDLQQMAEA